MAIRNNPFKPIIKQIPAPLRNKYFILLAVFITWMIFFDKHDFLTQWRLQQTLNKMEEDRTYYDEKIQETWQDKQDNENDPEKYAREHYYLQKDNEDVFIIVDEKE